MKEEIKKEAEVEEDEEEEKEEERRKKHQCLKAMHQFHLSVLS